MPNLIGPDVSFYQDDPETPRGIDFARMRQQTPYVIIRAGQNEWIDPDFQTNWGGSKLAGLYRGSYWFYDSRSTPDSQARRWFEAMGGDLGELPLWVDLEETYGGQYQGYLNWKLFIAAVQRLVGAKEIGIYTNFYYFKDHGPTDPTEKAYFHQFPLWAANYGTMTPAVPAPWSANEWLFHQYTDSGPGATYGVESTRIDLNQFNGDAAAFAARFGEPPAPPPTIPDEVYPTHAGIVYHKRRRFDTDCFIHVIDTTKVRMKLQRPFRSVPNSVRDNGAQLGFNFGGWGLWPVSSQPNEYLIIEGQVIQTKSFDGRPSMEVKKSGEIVFMEKQPNFLTSWNVGGFDRLIATAGVYNPRITDPNSEPRTVYGKTADGKLVILVCEGRLPNQKGLTFPECWSVMQEFGVTDCGNADGGYSSCAVNTAISPNPLNKSYLVENRSVVYQALFYAEGGTEPPPDGGTMPKYKVTITNPEGARERTGNSTAAPGFSPLLAFGSVHYSDKEIIADSTAPTDPNKKWIELVNGRFIAVRYPQSGGPIERATVELNGTDPSPDPTPGVPTLKHTIEVYSDGSLKIDGAPYP